MSQDTDGIDDALDGAVRIALTLASQMTARLARERERAAQEARGVADAETRETQARFAAERAAARAQLAPVERDAWWETATKKQVAEALQTAVNWQAVDARAAAAVEMIHRQVLLRDGVRTDQWLRQPDRSSASRSVTAQSAPAADSGAQLAEARRIPADSENSEPAVAMRDRRSFDSPDRRRERAHRLRVRGHDAATVAAVLSADVSQARPAIEAAVPAAASASRLAAPPRPQQLELRP
ncbi:hypothetical protein [Aquipuribacter nitratireducens]|uniref:Colicin import membrane protein n=1 Tax=Aquipuribacter nitratireducens TaxID=650104 RepID=A0ABW0GQ95_9MICO